MVFAPSVPMSVYLVAVVVGELEHVSASSGGAFPVQMGVWARPGMSTQLQYALDVGVAVLNKYNAWFGIPFPLPKCDMVAIPDFAAGAMENWGLITYRESALLASAATSSQSELLRVSLVVAHELAHQCVPRERGERVAMGPCALVQVEWEPRHDRVVEHAVVERGVRVVC